MLGPDWGGSLSDSFNNTNYSELQGSVMLSGDSTHRGARVTVLTAVLDQGRHQSATAGPHSCKHTREHTHTDKNIAPLLKHITHTYGMCFRGFSVFTVWTEEHITCHIDLFRIKRAALFMVPSVMKQCNTCEQLELNSIPAHCFGYYCC